MTCMNKGICYPFTAEVWQHHTAGGWFFVSVPIPIALEIRAHARNLEEGWGRLKSTVRVGLSEWDTAIWFDTKRSTYLLPMKADMRKRENITAGTIIDVSLWV